MPTPQEKAIILFSGLLAATLLVALVREILVSRRRQRRKEQKALRAPTPLPAPNGGGEMLIAEEGDGDGVDLEACSEIRLEAALDASSSASLPQQQHEDDDAYEQE